MMGGVGTGQCLQSSCKVILFVCFSNVPLTYMSINCEGHMYIITIIIIICNSYIPPNPTRLAQSTSQFKTRMDIGIGTGNLHTPDDPTSTAKLRQTCTHPGTISATQTCNAAIHVWILIVMLAYCFAYIYIYNMHAYMHKYTHTYTQSFQPHIQKPNQQD